MQEAPFTVMIHCSLSVRNAARAVIDLLNGLLGTSTGSTSGRHTSAGELNGIGSINAPLGSFINDPGRENIS